MSIVLDQGSTLALGSLLFLLCVDYLQSAFSKSVLQHFADDHYLMGKNLVQFNQL